MVVMPDLTFPTDRSLSVDTDDGARLAVGVAGEGRLVVVLHGTLVSSAVMAPLARRLVAEGYAVAALDLRGHGRSTAGRERISIRGYGRDLARVIETLAPEAYVLVGHSSGGMGALAFAEDPGTAPPPSGLVLISTSASSIGGLKERLAAPVLFNGGLGVIVRRPSLGRAFARALFAEDPGSSMLEEVRRILASNPEATMRTAPRAVLNFDLTPELERVTMPVLVLQGGRDSSVRPGLAQDLVAGLPNARYIAYPDAGHMLVLERTESVAREIVAFARSSLD
jgi:pimeloyl-ACP methyl ester carboxylesterase